MIWVILQISQGLCVTGNAENAAGVLPCVLRCKKTVCLTAGRFFYTFLSARYLFYLFYGKSGFIFFCLFFLQVFSVNFLIIPAYSTFSIPYSDYLIVKSFSAVFPHKIRFIISVQNGRSEKILCKPVKNIQKLWIKWITQCIT